MNTINSKGPCPKCEKKKGTTINGILKKKTTTSIKDILKCGGKMKKKK